MAYSYLRETFGPLRIFVFALPAMFFVIATAYHVVAEYNSVVFGGNDVLRAELLAQEPDVFWTDRIYLNSEWDRAAFPLLAKYKREVSIAVLLGPLPIFLFHLLCSKAKKANIKFDQSKDTKTLVRNFFAASVFAMSLGAVVLLFTPSGPGFLSCASASFTQCIGSQVLFTASMIWATVFCVSALLQLLQIQRAEAK